MASSKRDFEPFVTWLHQQESQDPSDVRRLTSLALAHFGELAQTSRQHNQRSVYMVRRARRLLPRRPTGSQTSKRLPPMALGHGDDCDI